MRALWLWGGILIGISTLPLAAQEDGQGEVKTSKEILMGFDAALESEEAQTRSFKRDELRTSVKTGSLGELDGRGIRIVRNEDAAASLSVSVVPDSGQNFSNILFKLDSTEFADSTTLEQLDQIAAAMKARPKLRFLLEGHTCDLGTESHNLGLSERRADVVRGHLLNLGVAPEQVVTLGFGEAEPLVPNLNESKRRLNRRVVIYLRS